MHQLPRPSSRTVAAAASAGNTNRATERLAARTPSNVDLTAYTERAGQEEASERGRERAGSMANQEREQTKLNQIIQVGGLSILKVAVLTNDRTSTQKLR